MTAKSDFLFQGLLRLPSKPLDTEPQATKKRYSETLSQVVAETFAGELRQRNFPGARPFVGEENSSGAERRMAGGIGAKKVDVTWATEESGLLLAISIKSINFIDSRTRNYQKNLTNRRGDMLFEAVTLHRRFPYAVVAGFFFLDNGAALDGTRSRRSTFLNAHHRFKLFTGRNDPAGRDEQLERFYIVLHNPGEPATIYLAGEPEKHLAISAIFDELTNLVAERNPDFYESREGKLIHLR